MSTSNEQDTGILGKGLAQKRLSASQIVFPQGVPYTRRGRGAALKGRGKEDLNIVEVPPLQRFDQDVQLALINAKVPEIGKMSFRNIDQNGDLWEASNDVPEEEEGWKEVQDHVGEGLRVKGKEVDRHGKLADAVKFGLGNRRTFQRSLAATGTEQKLFIKDLPVQLDKDPLQGDDLGGERGGVVEGLGVGGDEAEGEVFKVAMAACEGGALVGKGGKVLLALLVFHASQLRGKIAWWAEEGGEEGGRGKRRRRRRRMAFFAEKEGKGEV